MPRRAPRALAPPRPRKQPRQARARATVDAILEATTYILLDRGFDAMTTNQIAERAGVNIASLYQYFPNKQAVVAALLERHVEHTRAAIMPALERSRGASIEARVRALVEVMAAVHAVDPRLHELFTTLGPRLGFEPVHTDTDRAIAAASRAWVSEMRGQLPDPELALWVAHTAIHAVFHLAFVHRPDVASRPLLVDELVRLITPYLTPQRPPRARTARR